MKLRDWLIDFHTFPCYSNDQTNIYNLDNLSSEVRRIKIKELHEMLNFEIKTQKSYNTMISQTHLDLTITVHPISNSETPV